MAEKHQVGKVSKDAEDARKGEEDRIAAEKELMAKFQSERRLSSQRSLTQGGGLSSASDSVADSESKAEWKRKVRSPEDKEKKRTKTRKLDDGDEDGEETEDKNQQDPLVNLGSVLEKMRSWFKQPTIMKMVTKPQTKKFHRYFVRFQEELTRAREERARIETRIEERTELVRIVREELRKGPEPEVPRRPTGYAAAVARDPPMVPKVTGVKGPVLPPPKLVTIRHEGRKVRRSRPY